MLYQLEEMRVHAEGDYWIAETAAVLGAVLLKHNASIWFGAVVRGDREPITIGENSNIQDLAVLHTDPDYPLVIGDNVTVGHKATLHGCTIGNNTLIGIDAIVLSGAKIGANCLVGAGALVTEGKVIPDGSMVLGVPGKVVRQLDADQIAGITRSAESYVANFKRYKQGLVRQAGADLT
jgi:carbonic anhydrase/acetyltransferase-like protein (isoleucine patch superfamily)